VNGAHDLGGMHGLGKVVVESNEPIFHARWEKVVFAINFAVPANSDEFRHSIEKMNGVHYLSSRYYEHWLCGLENILLEKGMINKAELDKRTQMFKEGSFGETSRIENPNITEYFLKLIKEGGPSDRDVKRNPKFKLGDHVLTKNMNPIGHTRLPRYARGKSGIVSRVHGAFVFPDSNAAGLGENPQHLYTVRFEGRDLWGEVRSENGKEALYLDLWESYLEHAS
jgi:nitrile hydratase beta subunit